MLIGQNHILPDGKMGIIVDIVFVGNEPNFAVHYKFEFNNGKIIRSCLYPVI
jgi:hypothetical protein